MHKRYLYGYLMNAADPEKPGGGGTGTPPVFDPEAFKAALMADVNKTLNGGMSRIERLFGSLALKPPDKTETVPPVPDEKHIDPRFAAYDKQLVILQKANEDLTKANTTEKKARLAEAQRTKLSNALEIEGESFKTPGYKATALRELQASVTFDENTGEIITPDNSPLLEYAAKFIKAGFPDLLKPLPVGGAGAGSGAGSGGAGGGIDINMPLTSVDPKTGRHVPDREAISKFRAEIARVMAVSYPR